MNTVKAFTIFFLASIGFFCAAVSSASAATYYVATTGNDGNSCASAQNIATPKRTVQNGIGCLNAGDTLYIRAGTYAENFVVNRSGTVGNPITIAGYPGDTRPLIRSSASDIIWINVGSSNIILKNFDIDGIPQGNNGQCMQANYVTNVTVENIICSNPARDGFSVSGTGWVFRNNQILNCGRIQPSNEPSTKGLGIYTGDMTNSLLENNIIDGCRGGGFAIHYDTQNTIYRNNIIRNTGCASPWGCVPETWDGGTGRKTGGTSMTIGGAGASGKGPSNTNALNKVTY
jgi:parallel beta-helix repeat protein